MKAYIAAPPDVLRVDEKNLREHYVLNVCGVIITTNHKTDGIYLPADDRRHLRRLVRSDQGRLQPTTGRSSGRWYDDGGFGHVAAYLAKLDLSGFDPKAPPPKTPAFWEIVDANRAPEDAELADVLDKMGTKIGADGKPEIVRPQATTLVQSWGRPPDASHDFYEWLDDRKNRRAIPHRLEKCGYSPVRNDTPTMDFGRSMARGR